MKHQSVLLNHLSLSLASCFALFGSLVSLVCSYLRAVSLLLVTLSLAVAHDISLIQDSRIACTAAPNCRLVRALGQSQVARCSANVAASLPLCHCHSTAILYPSSLFLCLSFIAFASLPLTLFSVLSPRRCRSVTVTRTVAVECLLPIPVSSLSPLRLPCHTAFSSTFFDTWLLRNFPSNDSTFVYYKCLTRRMANFSKSCSSPFFYGMANLSHS